MKEGTDKPPKTAVGVCLGGQGEGNIIDKATVEAIANPSRATRSEKAQLVRNSVKRAERAHDGEVVLLIVSN